MKIIADENIPGLDGRLSDEVELLRLPGRQIDAASVRDATALLVRSVTQVDARLVAGSTLRFVGSATAGIDHIDREALAAADIPFAHAPGSNANAVVEYVLAAIVSVEDYLERLQQGGRVGVVGYGHVGRTLVARLSALGVVTLAYDPWLPSAEVPGNAPLADVLACDVVTLHPELTDREPFPSRHLLDEDALGALTQDQLLINASRGGVIDNHALCLRLQQPQAPRVVLDVWEGEPVIDPALLRRVDRGTPHVAGYSLDGKLRGTGMLLDALAGHCPEAVRGAGRGVGEGRRLIVPDALSANALLRHLLLDACPLAVDDERLRKVPLEADPGAAFDRLRRDYAVRREIAGSSFDVTLPAAQAAILSALGAVPAVVP